ncbi:MAG: hypothetical protein EBT27_12095, partial [Betaproteobacteria bacterium]|nr:hypothetical protein [Betaproteobacteria bacterium]
FCIWNLILLGKISHVQCTLTFISTNLIDDLWTIFCNQFFKDWMTILKGIGWFFTSKVFPKSTNIKFVLGIIKSFIRTDVWSFFNQYWIRHSVYQRS